ncbi:MAG: type II toxin-antitoxin system MqsA family antitoxin [Verrucomicrobiota bacterium]
MPSKKKIIKLRPYPVVVPTPDGKSVADHVTIKVPMEWDEELKEWLITAEAEELIETTKARHMGLMLPADLLAMRQRLNLSQRQIGELLKIGAKSWTRWESGAQRPSQSINLLLRLLDKGAVSPQQLVEIGSARADWSRQFDLLALASARAAPPVSLDLCRSTPPPSEPLRTSA